jgi:hypothetical protein
MCVRVHCLVQSDAYMNVFTFTFRDFRDFQNRSPGQAIFFKLRTAHDEGENEVGGHYTHMKTLFTFHVIHMKLLYTFHVCVVTVQ